MRRWGETAGAARAQGGGYWCSLPPVALFQKSARRRATYMPPRPNFFIPPTMRGSRCRQRGSVIPMRCLRFPPLVYPPIVWGIPSAASTTGQSATHILPRLSSFPPPLSSVLVSIH